MNWKRIAPGNPIICPVIIDPLEAYASICNVEGPLDFVLVPPCYRKLFMHKP